MPVTHPAKLHAIVERTEYSPLFSSDLFGEIKKLATPREMEVMQHLDDGLKMSEISRLLKISTGRVQQLRASIGRKIRRAQRILEVRENVREMISPNNATTQTGKEKIVMNHHMTNLHCHFAACCHFAAWHWHHFQNFHHFWH
jgi:DNA-directed RNA polymerase specialized sigma24 family protein